MLLLQLVLAKNGQMSYLYISLLPAMILCFPTWRPTWWVMTAAFLSGLAVDVLADGMPGLNACAIIPVAALQKPLISLCIDDEIVERNYSFSFHQNGLFKIGMALLLSELLFFIIYVNVDGAGCRTFGFNFLKIIISVAASFAAGMLAITVLAPRQKR